MSVRMFLRMCEREMAMTTVGMKRENVQECTERDIYVSITPVADPGGHAPRPPPRLVKISQKRWPPNAEAYISCFLALPLSEVSGPATVL